MRKLCLITLAALSVACAARGAGQLVTVVNDGKNALGVDLATRTLQTIDYAHHEIHGGNHYHSYVTDAELDTDETNLVLIVTADSAKWPHITLNFSCSVAATMKRFAGVISTNLGTGLAEHNNDQNSTNVSTTVMYSANPAFVTSWGTQKDETLIGSTLPQAKSGGGGSREDEFIIAQNSTNAVLLIGNADSGRANLRFTWYMHTNKTD